MIIFIVVTFRDKSKAIPFVFKKKDKFKQNKETGQTRFKRICLL